MKAKILDFICIIIGAIIVSVGFVFFINPYKFVPGGVFGSSIVLHTLIPSLQVGTLSYMISIPLLILSYFLLGKGIGVKTLFATLITPLIMNALSALAYPSQEALQALDPAQICGGMLDLSDNLILAAIIGPVIVGIGSGFIMKGHATTGGTDIIAMILHKYLRFKFSNALLCVDTIIVALGLMVIGFGVGTGHPAGSDSILLSFYSLICIFLMSRTLAFVVSGSKHNKLVFIITKHHNTRLRDYILNELCRTATIVEGEGLYSLDGNSTYMMVLPMRQVEQVTAAIKDLDPDSFVIVTDCYDAYGKRWKAFPEKHAIELS